MAVIPQIGRPAGAPAGYSTHTDDWGIYWQPYEQSHPLATPGPDGSNNGQWKYSPAQGYYWEPRAGGDTGQGQEVPRGNAQDKPKPEGPEGVDPTLARNDTLRELLGLGHDSQAYEFAYTWFVKNKPGKNRLLN